MTNDLFQKHPFHPAIREVAEAVKKTLQPGVSRQKAEVLGVPVEFAAENAIKLGAVVFGNSAKDPGVVAMPLADGQWQLSVAGKRVLCPMGCIAAHVPPALFPVAKVLFGVPAKASAAA